MLHHARQLGEAFQRQLAPLPAHLGAAQGLDQVARLALQLFLRLGHEFQVLGERTESGFAILLHAADMLVGLVQRFADRLDHGLDGFFALLQLVARLVVQDFEIGFRELEKFAAAGFEDIARQ